MKITTIEQFRQAAFNGAFRGLRHQGFRQAKSSTGGCVMRTAGPDPLRCARGWLQPNTWGEGMEVRGFSELAPPLQEAIDIPFAYDFLSTLVMDHDDSTSPADMEARLRGTAAQFNLTIPDEAQ